MTSNLQEVIVGHVPWIPYVCYTFLDTVVKQAMAVFEFGSGGSTIYFARKHCQVTSVENNQTWFDAVQAELRRKKYTWIDLRLIPAGENCIGQDVSDPEHYYEPPCEGNFQQYASEIDKFPDQQFDIIVVDGVARPSCLQHAHTKLKSGGYLVLDNTDRPHYLHTVGHLFRRWERCTFWGHGPINSYMWECTIWRKP